MMQPDVGAMAMAQEVKNRSENDLLAKENVVGVGLGFKEKGGKRNEDELAVTVYVTAKKNIKDLAAADRIAEKLDVPGSKKKVLTDVQEVGEVEAQAFTNRIRPTRPGFSVGHPRVTAGTFGCLVQQRNYPGRVYMLSNNHVFANENVANIGDPILQPGTVDGGRAPADIIARLASFVPLRFGGFNDYNLVDAALAYPTHINNVIAPIQGLGIPKGTVEAKLGMKVTKCGRTTEVTTGVVTGIDVTRF